MEKMPLVDKAGYSEEGSEREQPRKEISITTNIPEVELSGSSKPPESSQVRAAFPNA